MVLLPPCLPRSLVSSAKSSIAPIGYCNYQYFADDPPAHLRRVRTCKGVRERRETDSFLGNISLGKQIAPPSHGVLDCAIVSANRQAVMVWLWLFGCATADSA